MHIHHCAFKIAKDSSQTIEELSVFLGAERIREGYDQGREILMQFSNGWCVQFSEITDRPSGYMNKKESHLAFASECPVADRQRIVDWCKSHDIPVECGQWSDKELWLDCPDMFIDFAIEILDAS
ncbi:MAG: hypothetical protein ACOCWQ_05665 [Nanoarchaeota archaeon]